MLSIIKLRLLGLRNDYMILLMTVMALGFTAILPPPLMVTDRQYLLWMKT